MTHEEFEGIAALDVLGAASAEEETALREHVESCESCRKARDEFVQAASLLALDLNPVQVPAEARQRIMDNVHVGDTSFGQTHRRFGFRPWWLAVAAIVFLFLWGWRELGMLAAREHLASRDAEIRQLKEENARLNELSVRLGREMALLATSGTKMFVAAASPKENVRVFVDGQGNALVMVDKAPPNSAYRLWANRTDQPKPQNAGDFDVPSSGQRTLLIRGLPPLKSIKSFSLTPR
jgi:hypothetical protein